MDHSSGGGGTRNDSAGLGPGGEPRPKGKPGRKPKGTVPTVVTEIPSDPARSVSLVSVVRADDLMRTRLSTVDRRKPS